MKKILFINPPIYDFSAYDFWLKPYGLIKLAGYLRNSAEVTYFDFMDRFSPYLDKDQYVSDRDDVGRGGFYSQLVEKPKEYAFVTNVRFKRFGVPEDKFINLLKEQYFDCVFITSAMTYWYLGVKEVVENIKKYQPKTPIVLGGIYATLCYEHANSLGVDLVIKGSLGDCENLKKLEAVAGVRLELDEIPFWEGYERLSYGVLKLNDGCPLNCSYCSVKKFYPNFQHRSLKNIFAEAELLFSKGVKNIVFYDDALLVDPEKVLFPFLSWVNEHQCRVNFHTPNAMHVRLLTPEMSSVLKENGFRKLFMGFESSSLKWQQATSGGVGNKTTVEQFESAISALKGAGFVGQDLTAYVMVGHPKQEVEEVIASLKFVNGCGARSMLSEFSPIPETADGEECRKFVDISEPLFHNSSVFPLFSFGQENMKKIKDLVRELNKKI